MRGGRKGGMRDQLSGDESSQVSRQSVRRTLKFCEKLPARHNGRYEYQDAQGDVLFVVQRYEKDGTKFFVQYTPIYAKKGKISWLKCLKIDGPRPLYRLPTLLECDRKRPIMVVEGEKCVEAVLKNSRKAFPITWAGRTKDWQKTDWSPLHGRPLILVADGDEAGHMVMKALAAHLRRRCPMISLVLPPIAPGGLDIADEIEAGRDVNAWLEKYLIASEPGVIGGRAPDRSPSRSSERDNDEWSSLIAEGRDKPGVFFEEEKLRRLAILAQQRLDKWMNLRVRIKLNCKHVLIRDLDKAIKALTVDGTVPHRPQNCLGRQSELLSLREPGSI